MEKLPPPIRAEWRASVVSFAIVASAATLLALIGVVFVLPTLMREQPMKAESEVPRLLDNPVGAKRLVLVVIDGLGEKKVHEIDSLQRVVRENNGTSGVALAEATVPTTGAGIQAITEGVVPKPLDFLWDRSERVAKHGGFLETNRRMKGKTYVAGPDIWFTRYAKWIDLSLITKKLAGEDDQILAGALARLKDPQWNVVVVHFTGYAANVLSDTNELHWCDGAIAQIAEAAGPEAAMFVTSSFGTNSHGGHFSREPEITQVPVIAWGPGAPQIPAKMRLVELSAFLDSTLTGVQPFPLTTVATTDEARDFSCEKEITRYIRNHGARWWMIAGCALLVSCVCAVRAIAFACSPPAENPLPQKGAPSARPDSYTRTFAEPKRVVINLLASIALTLIAARMSPPGAAIIGSGLFVLTTWWLPWRNAVVAPIFAIVVGIAMTLVAVCSEFRGMPLRQWLVYFSAALCGFALWKWKVISERANEFISGAMWGLAGFILPFYLSTSSGVRLGIPLANSLLGIVGATLLVWPLFCTPSIPALTIIVMQFTRLRSVRKITIGLAGASCVVATSIVTSAVMFEVAQVIGSAWLPNHAMQQGASCVLGFLLLLLIAVIALRRPRLADDPTALAKVMVPPAASLRSLK